MLHGNRKYPPVLEEEQEGQQQNFNQLTASQVLDAWNNPELSCTFDIKYYNNNALLELLCFMLRVSPNERYNMEQVMSHTWVHESKAELA